MAEFSLIFGCMCRYVLYESGVNVDFGKNELNLDLNKHGDPFVCL